MCVPPPPDKKQRTVKTIIKAAVPAAANVESIDLVVVPSAQQLQRHFQARISDGSTLLLSLPPPLMVKLLRSERACVSSEAAVLAWIAESSIGTGLQGCAYWEWETERQREKQPKSKSRPSKSALESSSGAPGDKKRSSLSGESSSGSSSGSGSGSGSGQLVLARSPGFLPSLVSHSPALALSEPEFNIVKPTTGTPLCALSPVPTSSEKRAIGYQNGVLIRRLSKLQSPTGKFGPALGVLGGPAPSSRRSSSPRAWDPRASDSWSAAFATLMEGVLRDGEDMQVTLSYSAIRQHFQRFGHLLDAVTVPCLVVVNAGEDDNILVVRETKSSSSKSASSKSGSKHEKSSQKSKSKGKGRERDSRKSSSSSSSKGKARQGSKSESSSSSASSAHTGPYKDAGIAITGLRDWSNCVFGDPLFATVFCQDQTVEFWTGFDDPLDDEEVDALGAAPCLIEDWSNAKIRMLLYECYHSVTRVVREFYRPSKDSSRRELAARKALNSVMTKLDAAHDEGSNRRRRPSGDMSPAKRYKTDDDDEDDDDDEYDDN